MDSQGMLLPDIKEEELINSLILPEKMDFIETVKSNDSSTMDESNKTLTQLNNIPPDIPMNNSDELETSENIITPDNTTILLSSSLKMPVSNEDLSLLPPLPNTNELNVPTEQPIQPSPLQTEIISSATSVVPLTTTTPENEELNLINALDMNTNETTHLSRSSSLKSVLKATLSHQENYQQQDLEDPHHISTAVPPPLQHIHIPLPRSLSRSNSQRRDRNTSFSSNSSASPSPSSQLPTLNNTSSSSNPTTSNTSPKFPLLRRASSKLLRKASFKSLNNGGSGNNSNNQSTTSITSHHKIRTSPLILQTGFDNSTPSMSNSSSSSSIHANNNNNMTPVTSIPKSRPSLRLRLSSNTLSSSTSNTPQPQQQQPPLQRTSSILSRKSSLGSKMKLNLSRIISGSSKHPPPLSHHNSNDHIPPVTSPTYIAHPHSDNNIISNHSIVTPRKSISTNPSPSTISSFPISHNGKDSNPLTKMVSIDLQKINKLQPTIVTLDDTLSDIVTISKESAVSMNLITEDAKNQISLKDYYALLQDMSRKEDAKLRFIEDKFNQSGWCSNNELNQLKQKRVIINKLWKEKLHGHDIKL